MMMMGNLPVETMAAVLATKTLQYSKAVDAICWAKSISLQLQWSWCQWTQWSWCQWTQSPSSWEHLVLSSWMSASPCACTWDYECQPLCLHLGL